MDSVSVNIEVGNSKPVEHAVAGLKEALATRGFDVLPSGATAAVRVVAGIAGQKLDGETATLLATHGLSVPEPAESLLIKRFRSEGTTTLLVAGRDERGLVHALNEVAQAVACAAKHEGLGAVKEGRETPFLKLRSISVALQNQDLERDWYFSEDHWRRYFAMLVRNRFNRFLLRFADQTNYMAPPYPWLFALNGYSEVGVEGLTDSERARNLAMLRRIGELAREHGLDFGLAIWQQQPVVDKNLPSAPHVRNYGPSAVRNLPTGARLTDYTARALARLLDECPAIRALQLRLNDESGIPEPEQPAFFRRLFDMLAQRSPPIQLDLRYKGLKQETVDQAVAAGLDVMVSTKFWCEHLGLPFHPTTQDPLYSASRYGYGTLLRRPRHSRIGYQLWNQGSNRLLTWGDADYAARFARSCAEGDGDGFEVFAPLTNRGWGNEPGGWRLLAEPGLEHYRWESERYWAFYLAFGRQGYDPDTAKEVWQREFRVHYGAAAANMAKAYHSASWILPLITASGMTSASEWGFWPEMDLCGSLEAFSVMPPGDYGQFYGIRAWKAVQGWTYDRWSASPRGFVEDALAGEVEAKWTPIQVSRELDRLASEALQAVESAERQAAVTPGSEIRVVGADIRALACLARYHAARKRAATHLAFFRATGEAGRLVKVEEDAAAALGAWEALVQATDGVYSSNLVFGRSREAVGVAARPVNAHAGHWKDRLPNVKAELAFARKLLAENQGAGKPFKTYPGEVPPVRLPVIHHQPVASIGGAATDIRVEARVESEHPLTKVLLRFRAMDQTKPWEAVAMQDDGEGRHHAVIASERIDASADLLYYLEARIEGGGTLWPDWRTGTPYVKVSIAKE